MSMEEVNLVLTRESIQDKPHAPIPNFNMPLLTIYFGQTKPQESEESVRGAWKTESALAQMEGWDESQPYQQHYICQIDQIDIWFLNVLPFFDLRQMAKNAVKWATSKGLNRINEIHGKAEYRVPTDFEFKHKDLERATTTASSETVLEDIDAQYLLQGSLGAQVFWGFPVGKDGIGILTGPDAGISAEGTIQSLSDNVKKCWSGQQSC